MITANISTHPSRYSALLQTLASIEGQFDVVRICLNDFTTIPAELADMDNVECYLPATDLGDGGRFTWLAEAEEEVYFTLGDAIIFPPDFADRMYALLTDATIVSCGGRNVWPTADGDTSDTGAKVYDYETDATVGEFIMIGDTRCMAIRSQVFHPDVVALPEPMDIDLIIALAAAEDTAFILLAAHNPHWLKAIPCDPYPAFAPPKQDAVNAICNRLWALHRQLEMDGNPAFMRKVCYTVITGNYDTLRQPEHITPGWKYVCLTDNVDNITERGIWGVGQLEDDEEGNNPIKVQRRHKIIAPFYEDWLRTIYVDGNMTITGDLDIFVHHAQHKHDVVTVRKHPNRDCVFDEAKAVIDLKLDTNENVNRWLYRLHAIGRKAHAGLSETGVLIRDYEDYDGQYDSVGHAMRLWASLVSNFSHRDQLTFDFAMDTFGVANRVDSKLIEQFVKWSPHSAERVAVVEPEPAEVAEPATPGTETLGILCQCDASNLHLAPLFVMVAQWSNPDAFVTVLMPKGLLCPDFYPVILQNGMRYAAVMHEWLWPNNLECNPDAVQWVVPPAEKTDLLYICPVTDLIVTDLRKTMLPLMEKNGTAYVNTVLPNYTRLGTRHFTKLEAMHPNGFATNPAKDLFWNPQLLLFQIVQHMTAAPILSIEAPDCAIDLMDATPAAKPLRKRWDKFRESDHFNTLMQFANEDLFVALDNSGLLPVDAR